MNIIELRASGFARLTAVEIRPDGHMVPITGKNRQGKTSILKAIWSLILGASAAPAVAINKDAEQCTLFGDFGEFKITRTVKRREDGTEHWDLKVVDASGARITKTPQAVINGWLGALTFDPLEFARLDAKKQFDRLKVLVPDFDFDATAKARKEAFDARTDVNRQQAQAEAAANAVPLPPGAKPAPPADVTDLLARIDAADAAKRNRIAEENHRINERNQVDLWRDEAETLRAKASQLEKRANEREAELDAMAPLDDLAIENIEALRAQITGADQTRQTIALFEQRDIHREAAIELKAKSAKLTAQIEAFDTAKAEAIAKAKLPVEGLSFGDDEILFNNVPFAQASTMEMIMTGAALAMAMTPKLKVMTIDEASELDSAALKTLADMAEQHGFSIWYTKVDEAGEVGFVIEDGALAQ